jgi:hypothetical protein
LGEEKGQDCRLLLALCRERPDFRGEELDLGLGCGGCGGEDKGKDEVDQLLQGHKTSCTAIRKSVPFKTPIYWGFPWYYFCGVVLFSIRKDGKKREIGETV